MQSCYNQSSINWLPNDDKTLLRILQFSRGFVGSVLETPLPNHFFSNQQIIFAELCNNVNKWFIKESPYSTGWIQKTKSKAGQKGKEKE